MKAEQCSVVVDEDHLAGREQFLDAVDGEDEVTDVEFVAVRVVRLVHF